MSKEFDNKGRGVLFPAKERKTDRHPHYTGEFTDLNGQTYWLSGWKNRDRNDKPYLSIALGGEKEEKAPKDHRPPDDFDDDIPF